MTEKRYEYCQGKYRHYIQDVEKDGVWRKGYIGTYGEFDLDKITELLNKFDSENKRLKIKNKGLQSELQIFKEDVEYNNLGVNAIKDNVTGKHTPLSNNIADKLNELNDENKELRRVIEENEKMIQSIYEELSKLRIIKKNLRNIKTQWNWIMESVDYD